MRRQIWLMIFGLAALSEASAQYLPGLSYCLLFDTGFEKDAFQKSNDEDLQPLLLLLSSHRSMDASRYNALEYELTAFADKLAKKKGKYASDAYFLKFVFYRIHHKYLRSYQAAESFVGIFDQGNYNCISGSALFAFILNELNYNVSIHETRYHMFLTVRQDSLEALLETTDPFDGFVSGRTNIMKRIEGYINHEKERLSKDDTLSAPFAQALVLNTIDMIELAGLHYYNLGVAQFNQKSYYDAFRDLKKASFLYPESQRIKDLLLLSQSKFDSQLSASSITSKF